MNFKEIKKLYQKKYRIKNGLFIVEGKKSVATFLHSTFELELLLTTESNRFEKEQHHQKIISEKNLEKITHLEKNEGVLAIFKIPKTDFKPPKNALILALDNVKDPGNLGTIIRICHWFGIENIMCNKTTVDAYNPKVVQASMGSLAYVKIHYTNLTTFLKNTEIPIFGATIDGASIYKTPFKKEGIILMGSESHGISKSLKSLCNKTITVPNFSIEKSCESLNVAIATGIILSQIKNQSITQNKK